MRDYFYTLADLIGSSLQGGEVFTCYFSGEDSDFIRFNQNRVRQAGHVLQQSIALSLIEGPRHTDAQLTLSGDLAADRPRLRRLIEALRAMRSQVPVDPYLCYATEVHSAEQIDPNRLPPGLEMVEQILKAGRGQDLVGIHACGAIHRGFANSLGQRNWLTRHSFNLDWSLYLRADKAVKARYAGFEWQDEAFQKRMRMAREQLQALARPARTIAPGAYRAYLAPAALNEIVELLGWGGFSLHAHRTGTSPLLRMTEEGAGFHPLITLSENAADGIAPPFQEAGYIRPPRIGLIEQGVYRNCLVSPRSAMEYGLPTNGAGDEETPLSLEMAAGRLPMDGALQALDTGLYISNIWYLNYSDRNAGRLTGMTRFATFWVENGRIEAPLNVMRFDETIYRLLGDHLLGLTAEREMLLDPGSYGGRSTRSARLPGALVDSLTFTL